MPLENDHIPCILQGTDTAHHYATGKRLRGGFTKHKGKCAQFNIKQERIQNKYPACSSRYKMYRK